jgi:ATP-dependent Clp protease ATP-binding subunit ClpA
MDQDGAGSGELRGLGPSAVRAMALAEREARELGHERVGTEHLLLGLLTNDSDTSKLLADAGMTLAATRAKVSEAVGAHGVGTTGISVDAARPRTARADRALGRAARFAHAEGSDIVDSEHLLWGVLDVEGTAGQVLRGLGVDVDSLRDQLETPEAERETRTSRGDAVVGVPAAVCPSCGVVLDMLSYRLVPATSESGPEREAVLYSCENCGRVLGVAPA